MSDFLNPHLTRPAVRWTSGDALPAVEQTGPAAPLLVDASTGRLLVDTEANLSADLSAIEGKQDTANAILTTTAADVAAIKSPLSGVTQTSTGGKVGLDVNLISGGSGGGGASASYNATLPTYTSGASTTLQTDVNGRLITVQQSQPLPTGAATSANQATANTSLANLDADVGNVADAAATSDTGSFSLIALTKRLLGKLTDGTQTTRIVNGANTLAVDSSGAISANTSSVQVFSTTSTASAGAVAIGPINTAQIRSVSVQFAPGGAGVVTGQVSNDNTNWTAIHLWNPNSGIVNNGQLGAGNIGIFGTQGFNFFRLLVSTNLTGSVSIIATGSAVAPVFPILSVGGTVAVSNGFITPQQQSGSGFSLYHTLISAASTNATSVATGARTLGTCVLSNTSASWRYVKFYNLASAPTVGTSTPVIQFPVAPNSTLDVSMSFAGLRFATGMAYAITSGSALLDTGAVAAGDVMVNLTYV